MTTAFLNWATKSFHLCVLISDLPWPFQALIYTGLGSINGVGQMS